MRAKTLDPTKTGPDVEALERDLRDKIVGQEDAIHEVVEMYQTYVSGLSAPGRPIANLMFLGPTGSGKTRLVEALAECLLQDRTAVLKIDCAEFQHSHEIAKLIGSPPGYLGHRETRAILSQEALNQYQTPNGPLAIVLFDEIEKASDSLWNLMLGILDKATLTLGDNTRVDFSKAMIFMTSNIGAREMSALMKPRLGFSSAVECRRNTADIDERLSNDMSRSGIQAARSKFTPEFVNRLDKMIVFKPLGSRELNSVLDIELNAVRQRVLAAKDGLRFGFAVTASGKRLLLDEGTNAEYGARHLKRAIERLVVQPLSRLVASGQICDGDWIQIDAKPHTMGLSFTCEEEGFLPREMPAFIDAMAASHVALAGVM